MEAATAELAVLKLQEQRGVKSDQEDLPATGIATVSQEVFDLIIKALLEQSLTDGNTVTLHRQTLEDLKALRMTSVSFSRQRAIIKPLFAAVTLKPTHEAVCAAAGHNSELLGPHVKTVTFLTPAVTWILTSHKLYQILVHETAKSSDPQGRHFKTWRKSPAKFLKSNWPAKYTFLRANLQQAHDAYQEYAAQVLHYLEGDDLWQGWAQVLNDYPNIETIHIKNLPAAYKVDRPEPTDKYPTPIAVGLYPSTVGSWEYAGPGGNAVVKATLKALAAANLRPKSLTISCSLAGNSTGYATLDSAVFSRLESFAFQPALPSKLLWSAQRIAENLAIGIINRSSARLRTLILGGGRGRLKGLPNPISLGTLDKLTKFDILTQHILNVEELRIWRERMPALEELTIGTPEWPIALENVFCMPLFRVIRDHFYPVKVRFAIVVAPDTLFQLCYDPNNMAESLDTSCDLLEDYEDGEDAAIEFFRYLIGRSDWHDFAGQWLNRLSYAGWKARHEYNGEDDEDHEYHIEEQGLDHMG